MLQAACNTTFFGICAFKCVLRAIPVTPTCSEKEVLVIFKVFVFDITHAQEKLHALCVVTFTIWPATCSRSLNTTGFSVAVRFIYIFLRSY